MKIEFTPHQKEAVDVKRGNILVSAAAGSGKTAVLTERVISLITGDEPVPCDKIIVVTYTVAAAEEMRRRISEKLSEKILEQPDNKLLSEQQLLLYSAHIQTIHSLCSSLIRDHFQELSISEEIKIADEARLGILQNEALSEALEAAYSAETPEFLRLVELCSSNKRDDKRLCEMTLSTYSYIRSFAFPLKFLAYSLGLLEGSKELSDNIWASLVYDHTEKAFAHAKELLLKALSLAGEDSAIYEKYSPAIRSDIELMDRVCKALSIKDIQSAALAAGEKRLPLGALRKPENPELAERVKNLRKKASKLTDDVTNRYLGFTQEDFEEDNALLIPIIKAFFALITDTYERIEEKKRDLSLLDYSDLEHLTLKLLIKDDTSCENGISFEYEKSEAAKALSEQFEYIMIDECQDINEVQNLIFKLLSQNEENIYMVGDVKQSIYRFRQARPEIFTDKKNRFKKYDEKSHIAGEEGTITLEANFRSRAEVCSAVNYIFGGLMTKKLGELDYTSDEALVAGASYDEKSDAAPELHILDYQKDEEEAKSGVEARYIASYIKTCIASGFRVKGKSGERNCEYRDFAILLRRKKETAKAYADMLTSCGIPCISDSTDGYFSEYEITVVLNLLRVIDNPLLDLPLLSVLLSPVLGFSADKVSRIRLQGKKIPLYTALCRLAKNETDSEINDFLKQLSDFRQNAALLSPVALIQLIYDKTDFAVLSSAARGSATRSDSERKNANLRLLLNFASQYEGFGSGGLSGFLRYIDTVIENKKDFSCANVNSESENAVQIMSIHASKGLEFPICIVADCAKGFNKQDLTNTYQMHSSLGFCMKITSEDGLRSYYPFQTEAIKLGREREMLSEEMRVLYVALTRAKEKLVMVMTLQNAEKKLAAVADSLVRNNPPSDYETFSAKNMGEWLLMVLLRHPDLTELRQRIDRPELDIINADFPLIGRLVNPEQAEESISAEAEKAALPDEEAAKSLREGFEFEYANAPLTLIPAKLTVTQIAKKRLESEITLTDASELLSGDGAVITPAMAGTVLHSFMQFSDFKRAMEGLEDEIQRLIDLGYFTKAEAEALQREKIIDFLKSGLCKRILENHSAREYKFNFFLKAGEVDENLQKPFSEEEIFIQGIADCIIFEPDGIVIVDYKTDRAGNDAVFRERYHDQLRLYKQAVEKIFNDKVKQCLIYSLYLSKEIEMNI